MACDICELRPGLLNQMWDGDALHVTLCPMHADQWDSGYLNWDVLGGNAILELRKTT